MVKCQICGDLKVKYVTDSGKRKRYFCSEGHALQYQMKQINRHIPKKYKFKSIDKMIKNPYFKKGYKKL